MARHNVWMSVSDLMTGLMVIFLFVAIAYMIQVQKNQSAMTEYVETKQKLHEKLVREFAADTARWRMVVGKDLSMKFKEPEVLFKLGSGTLEPKFKEILDEFIPRYLDILLNDTLRTKIQEIRIEGHTDTLRMVKFGQDSYLSNILLSQERAYNVLRYIREMSSFQKYTKEQKKMLDYWFTANGLSYGKALDAEGDYAFRTGKPIDMEMSRRVEFRIVTNGDSILESFVTKINKLPIKQ
ncbi:MAG: OmpA family protein [Prevotella sp.]|nr:OmpA family protein [Prevotella sp.]